MMPIPMHAAVAASIAMMTLFLRMVSAPDATSSKERSGDFLLPLAAIVSACGAEPAAGSTPREPARCWVDVLGVDPDCA
jgi:hypothetical protein